jgi:SAM-dependent methyltransferase
MQFCASDDWRRMVEELVIPAALGDLDLGDDVLEIGPGPGFTTDVVRTRVERLTTVEIDPGLAASLTRRLTGTNVEVVHGDATALDLPGDRFSSAISLNMLHHVPTGDAQDRVFAELARVLRRGGRLVAADSAPRDQLDDFHRGDTWNPIDPAALADRLTTAGFTAIEVGGYDLGWTCTAIAA